tara:strand:- start:8013 stop:10496 length:2484 start_codon:yes stop_codon:yes gene_type:complete
MATNEIEIEVTLDSKKAEKGFEGLEKEGEAIGKTFTGVGEVVKSVGGEMGEKMLQVGETFGGVSESVTGLSSAMATTGVSFTSLIGPIGLVTIALIEAYKALNEFFSDAEQREIKLNAYESGISDLKGTIQELTAAGVDLTDSESSRLLHMSRLIHEQNAEADSIQNGTKSIQEQITASDLLLASLQDRLATQAMLAEAPTGPRALYGHEEVEHRKEAHRLLIEEKELQKSLKSASGERAKQIKAELDVLRKRQSAIYEALSIETVRHNRAIAQEWVSSLEERINREAASNAALQEKRDAELRKAKAIYEEAAKREKELNDLKEKLAERSTENREKRAKVEAAMSHEAQLKSLQAQEQTQKTKTQIAVLEARRRAREIQDIENVSQDAKDALLVAEDRLLKRRLKQIAEEERKAQELKSRQAEALRRMAHARHLAAERQKQLELARVGRAEIENQRLLGVDQSKLLERQMALELELAGDNERAKLAIRLEFANKQLALEQDKQRKLEEEARKEAENAKRLADEERQRAEQRQAFIMESMEFDLSMQAEGIEKELALLELRYQREIALTDRSEAEITELTRRYNVERTKIINENASQGFNALMGSLNNMKEGILRSSAEISFDLLTSVKDDRKEALKALDEQFKKEEERIKQSSEEAAVINQQMTELTANQAREREKIRQSEKGAPSRMIGELLTALGKQAAVEALMFTAKGIGASFVDPGAAGGYFAAAATMGMAAVVAGYSGAQLSQRGGSSYSGGSISPESPTGSPQSAPAPERERAESTAMVFNINFGNSTIYDTKRAAQDAMASEILRTLNRQRRGAPRFAMG